MSEALPNSSFKEAKSQSHCEKIKGWKSEVGKAVSKWTWLTGVSDCWWPGPQKQSTCRLPGTRSYIIPGHWGGTEIRARSPRPRQNPLPESNTFIDLLPGKKKQNKKQPCRLVDSARAQVSTLHVWGKALDASASRICLYRSGQENARIPSFRTARKHPLQSPSAPEENTMNQTKKQSGVWSGSTSQQNSPSHTKLSPRALPRPPPLQYFNKGPIIFCFLNLFRH